MAIDAVPADTAGATSWRRWAGLSIVLVASFMDLLDVNVVNVALPSLQQGLRATYATVQLVAGGYTLALGIGLITGGRLGDIYGHKRMFLVGTAAFVLASLTCACAQTPGMLIGGRLVQGAGAAIMIPQVLAFIHVRFSQEELGRVVSIYAAITGVASVSGPILGGLLIGWNPFGLEWRTIFVMNVPVGCAAIALGLRYIDESRADRTARLDPVGMGLAAVALTALLFPIVQGRQLSWPVWCLVAMGASVPLAVAFVSYERRRIRREGSALVAVELFSRRSFSVGIIVQFLFQCAPAAFFLAWTIYLQFGLGWSAVHTGLTAIPFGLAVSLSGALSMRVTFPRYGRLSMAAGVVATATGMLGYAWLVGRVAYPSSWEMIVPLTLIGTGLGQVYAPLVNVTLREVPPQQSGSASGLINAIAQIGSSAGIAAIGILLFSAIGTQTASAARPEAPVVRTQLAASGLSGTDLEHQLAVFHRCTVVLADQPSQQAESCERGTTPAVAAAIARTRAAGFEQAFQEVLWCITGLLAIALLCIRALPHQSPAGAASAPRARRPGRSRIPARK